jgi:hypothetical protein
MTALDYLTEVPCKCRMNDVNVMAFAKVAAIIRGAMLLRSFSRAVSCHLAKTGNLRFRRRKPFF